MSDSTTTAIPAAKCQWCGGIHGHICPAVKAFEYHPDGTVKRVEFFAPNDYAQPLQGSWPWPAKPLEPYCRDPNVYPPVVSTAHGGAPDPTMRVTVHN